VEPKEIMRSRMPKVSTRTKPVSSKMITRTAYPVDGNFRRRENRYDSGMADTPNKKNMRKSPTPLLAVGGKAGQWTV
jgi:hypothetical protein